MKSRKIADSWSRNHNRKKNNKKNYSKWKRGSRARNEVGHHVGQLLSPELEKRARYIEELWRQD